MASSSYFLFVIGLCVCVTLLNPISCYGQYLFVFGDSLYDVGNNQYIDSPFNPPPSYKWPYGMTIHNATGRFSDGLVVPDFIAQFLNIPLVPPCLDRTANFTHGASFASGGAGVFNNSNNGAMNLRDQFGNFTDMLKIWNEEALSDGIFLFSMGGNDYFQFIHDNHDGATETEKEEIVQQVLGNFSDVLQGIYALGARKFVFQNVAPMGCLPMFKQEYSMEGDECAPFPLEMSTLHNTGLDKTLADLSTSLDGFTYSIFYYYDAIMGRIINASEYGFQVGNVSCCGTGLYNASNCGTEPYNLCPYPPDHVFFDGGHTTQHTNEQLAQLMWSADKDVIAPYNVRELLEIDVGKPSKLSGQIADEKIKLPSLISITNQ